MYIKACLYYLTLVWALLKLYTKTGEQKSSEQGYVGDGFLATL